MSGLLVAGIVGLLFAAATYLERAALKAELKKVCAKLANIELAVKAKAKEEIATAIADVKKWAKEDKADVGAVIAQIEARIKQIL
jgi:hypothetical protein